MEDDLKINQSINSMLRFTFCQPYVVELQSDVILDMEDNRSNFTWFFEFIIWSVLMDFYFTSDVLILSGSIGGSLGGIMLTYTFVKLFLYIRKKTKY